jgi:hypothetical protein
MALIWSIDAIPELAHLPPAERRRAWKLAPPPDFAHQTIVLRDDKLRLRRVLGLVCLAYAIFSVIVFLTGNSHGAQTLVSGAMSTVLGVLCVGVGVWAFCFPGTSQILDLERRVLLQSFNSFMGVRTVAIPFDDFTHIAADLHYIEDEFGGQIPQHRLLAHRKTGTPIELGKYEHLAPYQRELNAAMGLKPANSTVER